MLNLMINHGVTSLVHSLGGVLMPLMVFAFCCVVVLRWLIFFTIQSEYSFAAEFEKRVHKHLAESGALTAGLSFHQLTKQILDRTFHEHFELKHKFKRRRFDHITSVTDRLFLIEAGATRLVKDTLSQTKYLKKEGRDPKFLDVSKFVFTSNPIFNRLLGVLPLSMFHDIISVMPGLFVVGGILGTFMGTMEALPELSRIDVGNPDTTKQIMDAFLLKLAFSMATSILGILLSVLTTMLNTVLSPEGLYLNMVNKFASSLEFLWNDTEHNELSAQEREEPGDRRAVPDPGLVYQPPMPRATGAKPVVHAEPRVFSSSDVAEAEEETLARGKAKEALVALQHRLRLVEKAVADLEKKKTRMTPSAYEAELARWQEEKRTLEMQISVFPESDRNAA